MKKKLLFAVLLITGWSMLLLLQLKPGKIIEKNPSEKEVERDGVDKALQQDFERTKDLRTGTIPIERLWEAKRVKDQRVARWGSQRPLTAVTGINWTERGPSNIAGRTRAIMFDLSDAANGYDKVWAGAVGGGLWYTNNISAATPVWNKVNDFLDNIAVSCITQNPLNPQEMYFGTGEGWFNTDAIQGLGIWKTVDGGVNWTRLTATAGFNYVNDVLVDKNGTIYAAVKERVNSARGILRSADGGTTWTQVLGFPINSNLYYGADLEMAANGDVYASLGTDNSIGGIFRSDFASNGTNTGSAGTWTDITPNTAGTITSSGSWWRIELACAPSNANVVYALFEGVNSGNCTSIQSYSKATNKWTLKTVPTIVDQGDNSNFTRGQAWYDLVAAVDPNDSLSLYIGGIDALRSNNGGSSWTQMTTWSLFNAPAFTPSQNVHADQHAIIYSPGSSSRALFANDGGIAYTIEADKTSSKPTFISKNAGLNVTQFYSAAIHPTLNTDYFLAGAQDNGTQKFNSAGMNSTTEVSDGDGGFCFIDQNDPNIQISSYVYNNYYISNDGGNSFDYRPFNNNGSFINSSDYDNQSKILYAAGLVNAFSSINTFFRWNDPASAGFSTSSVTVSQFNGSAVTHVKVSPLTPDRVYFGLQNGSIIRVDNANTGTVKTGKIVGSSFTFGSISCIDIDPANEDHMLVTVSNYGTVSVFESKNATQPSPSFTAVEGNLPDMPVRWAIFDPRNSDWALLATELGVWSTNDLNGNSTDWQPTNSGLANVRVDMLKYRSSDRTLVAATHGRGLFTSVVPASTTPDINFATAIGKATEQTTATNGCRYYKDYTVQLNISNAPVGDATVQVNVDPTSTATQGADFDFTTNGNFASPASSFVFSSTAVTPKIISIRIYNDAEVENTELIKLTYTISGVTTAIKGTGFQSYSFAITDNDVVPGADGAGTYLFGTANNSAFNSSPFRTDKLKHRLQVLYSAADLRTAGFLSSGNITGMQLFVTSPNARLFNGYTISMANTTLGALSDFVNTPLTQVYTGNYTTLPAGQFNTPTANEFTFSTPFLWDGVSNIVVQFCYSGGPDLAGTSYSVQGNFAPFGTGVRASVYSDYTGGATDGCSLPSATLDDSRPRAAFIGSFAGTAVATALNTSDGEYLGAGNELYFYSAGNEVIARIKNLGAFDYGCTQAVIDRAGTGASPFWNNTPTNYLMNKTYRILPGTNNASGQYEVSFYFTKAEVDGWEAATGQSFANIQGIKVPSQIKNVTVATPAPDGAGSVQIVTPVRGTLGTKYTLSFTFSNGFSGFGFGIPVLPLPVTLIEFTGKLQDDHGYLEWSTSTEQNSDHFDVQKSFDGINYSSIGTVKAAGNSNSKLSYHFKDAEYAMDNNYYRLNLVDKDGRNSLSNIVQIRNFKNSQGMFVLNNPFKNSLNIRFEKVPVGKIRLSLTDLSGKLMYAADVNNSLQQLRWDLPKEFASGVYILSANIAGRQYTAKILKQ
jgi:hypothetical protein